MQTRIYMNFKELIDTYGRYISLNNQKLLSDSWEKLSIKAQNAIISHLQQTQKKEISMLNWVFQKRPEVYDAMQHHISQQRLESLHEIEKNNS